MKKLLLVAASLLAVFLSSAKIAQASQTDHLDFGVIAQSHAKSASTESAKSPVELTFDPPVEERAQRAKAPSKKLKPTKIALSASRDRAPSSFLATSSQVISVSRNTEALFAGGSNSLVARIVGHAEGTRTADGRRTRAYYGHVDPGNRAWNLGSFSYQHCDAQCTPEEADDRQLRRLRNQTELLQQKAVSYGLQMSLEEQLNGIDLANQAPLAALDQGGYIDRLRSARQQGFIGSEAVLWARTYSFMNPRTRTWEAPGLGNTYDSISHDQERRRQAIVRALTHQTSVRSDIASSTLR